MEVPSLGVELELQLPAYKAATKMPDLSCVCVLSHGSRQYWLLNPRSDARDQTQNLMVPSWICFCCTMTATPEDWFFEGHGPVQLIADTQRGLGHFCHNHWEERGDQGSPSGREGSHGRVWLW